MSYLSEAPDSPERAELYATDERAVGYVPEYTRVFGHRPAVYRAWRALGAAIKANMPLEHFEVATIAAAQERGSNYCALAHGKVLAGALDVPTVVAVAEQTDDDPVRTAVYRLAGQVAAAPAEITSADLEPLRALGLEDAEILDVVRAAAVRCFFSSVLSATGAQPDPALLEQDKTLVAALTHPA